jgi:nucleoid-associated protein YgaU
MNKTNKYGFFAAGIMLLFSMQSVSAAEGDTSYSEYVNSLRHNQYMLENLRLIDLAESSYAEGKYDDAVKYAQEAIQFAQLSDEYISLQMKIRDANDAIAAAQNRLSWAERTGAPKHYPDEYGEAQTAYAGSLEARSRENWDEALEEARRVLAALADLPEGPVLAAQYLVKDWVNWKDCLWNIAGKPEIYGDPWQWRHIYNANKNKLRRPDNPNLITPGTVLDIPSIRGETRSGRLE